MRGLQRLKALLATESQDVTAWALAVFAISAFVLLILSVPGIYVKDSGELVAAIRGMGVPHPTGFSLYCLTGKLFDLLPFGAGAFRANAFSAVSAAGAATLAFLLTVELARILSIRLNLVAALVSPIALIASHLFWQHATTTEVYAFSLAGMLLAFLAWVRGAFLQDARWLAVGAVVTGLGAGGHLTWPLYGAMVGFFALIAYLRGTKRFSLVPILVLLAILGSLVSLYLLAVANRGPYMNWGSPADLKGFLAHLTGSRIRTSFQDELSGVPLGLVWINFKRSVLTLSDGAIAIIPAALAGLVLLFIKRPFLAVVAFCLLLADLLFSARINPMGIVDWQTLLPSASYLAILAGVATVVLWDYKWGKVLVFASIAAALAQFSVSPIERRMDRVTAASDIVWDFLDALPPSATVFTSSDNLSSGLAGIQLVETARPDVLVLVKQHMSDAKYTAARLDQHGGASNRPVLVGSFKGQAFESASETPQDAVIRALAASSQDGAVWFELGEGMVDRAVMPNLEPDFPAFRYVEKQSSDQADEVAERAIVHIENADRWAAGWSSNFLTQLGIWAVFKNNNAQAARYTAMAIKAEPGNAKALNNMAVILRAEGDFENAIKFANLAVKADSSYQRGWKTLANTAQMAGDSETFKKAQNALKSFER